MVEKKVRVLIVDDSVLMREALRAILSSDPGLEVVGMARDGREGVEKALALKPDVITMDLRMPIMSGLETIEAIMEESPISIIVVSTMDVSVIVKALGIGAMDFVAVAQDIDAIAKDLIEKVKIASRVKPLRRMKMRPSPSGAIVSRKTGKEAKVVALGISTGGPQALNELFARLPAHFPAGILVVQHISVGFINGLAEWLKGNSPLQMQVAKAGDTIKPGSVLFAPDNYNMTVNESGEIVLREDVTKHLLHVPSIDLMMQSVAQAYGKDSIGVLMTGMGKDGFEGIKQIKAAGGTTIAQDEATSVVFGMNKMVIDAGFIDKVLPLHEIAAELERLV
ncbi:MAG: chemotaxis-specific protein-glutamate methyltransferase CheB [Candidatus Omnitrophota bacterium]